MLSAATSRMNLLSDLTFALTVADEVGVVLVLVGEEVATVVVAPTWAPTCCARLQCCRTRGRSLATSVLTGADWAYCPSFCNRLRASWWPWIMRFMYVRSNSAPD